MSPLKTALLNFPKRKPYSTTSQQGTVNIATVDNLNREREQKLKNCPCYLRAEHRLHQDGQSGARSPAWEALESQALGLHLRAPSVHFHSEHSHVSTVRLRTTHQER